MTAALGNKSENIGELLGVEPFHLWPGGRRVHKSPTLLQLVGSGVLIICDQKMLN